MPSRTFPPAAGTTFNRAFSDYPRTACAIFARAASVGALTAGVKAPEPPRGTRFQPQFLRFDRFQKSSCVSRLARTLESSPPEEPPPMRRLHVGRSGR